MTPPKPPPPPYAELAVTSCFLLSCAAPPSRPSWWSRPISYGHSAAAITDRNTLAGVVRAWSRRNEIDRDFKLIVGSRLVFSDEAPDVLAYAADREATPASRA